MRKVMKGTNPKKFQHKKILQNICTVARVFTALWVSLALMTAVPAGIAESGPPEGIQRGTEVVIGSPIAMNGQFGTEMWGSNSADMDVRAVLHGYETVSATDESFVLNETVITDMQADPASDGSVVYTLHLADNLYYNDGTQITARDFAFYFLLSGAPQVEEIGGTTLGLSHITGYEAYQAGATNVLTGVRVLSDSVLELRVTGVSFPYFYDLALLYAKPYPIAAIAPDCQVLDDGDGAYLSGIFTAELLRKTLLDPETGYQYAPKVTCGAYSLESYDGETSEARFVVNERFIGNYEGQTPHMERIVFRHVAEDAMLEALASGTVDLLNKVTDSAAPAQVQRLAEERGISIRQYTYPRTGFGFLAFACESSPTDSVAVRQAIAMSFDKDAFVETAMPGTGLRSYGYYGMGQWMASYVDEGDAAAGKAPLDAAERLAELDAGMDIEAAIALLESDGWTLNEKGEPYRSGQDDIRYRDEGGTLKPLTIRLALTEDNQIAGRLLEELKKALPQLGIDLEVTEMAFPQLLSHYYRQTERTYDMFFMASDFRYIFDPYYDFNTDEAYQGVVNASGLRDVELMALARDMRETESQDLRGYVEKWLAFQGKFVELMPMVPLYSNVYYDFCAENLGGLDITGSASWAQAILYTYWQK